LHRSNAFRERFGDKPCVISDEEAKGLFDPDL